MLSIACPNSQKQVSRTSETTKFDPKKRGQKPCLTKLFLLAHFLDPYWLPWSHFCRTNLIFLFKSWNSCQIILGKFHFYLFNVSINFLWKKFFFGKNQLKIVKLLDIFWMNWPKKLHCLRLTICQQEGLGLNNNFFKKWLNSIKITRNCQKWLQGNQLLIF